jgi:hypothetical protein
MWLTQPIPTAQQTRGNEVSFTRNEVKLGKFAVAVPARVAGFALCHDHYLTHTLGDTQQMTLLNFIQYIFAFLSFVSLCVTLQGSTTKILVNSIDAALQFLKMFSKIGRPSHTKNRVSTYWVLHFELISLISRCFAALLDTSESLAHWRSSWHPPGRPVGEGSGDADRTTQRSSRPKCCSHSDQNSSGRTLYTILYQHIFAIY